MLKSHFNKSEEGKGIEKLGKINSPVSPNRQGIIVTGLKELVPE